jgi:hypothetical protein
MGILVNICNKCGKINGNEGNCKKCKQLTDDVKLKRRINITKTYFNGYFSQGCYVRGFDNIGNDMMEYVLNNLHNYEYGNSFILDIIKFIRTYVLHQCDSINEEEAKLLWIRA